MSFATMAVSFITSASILVWIAVIVLTRIGAATIEIASESYFFKHVDKTDADMMGLFRMSHATAFSMMPLLGMAALTIIPLQYLFVVFGIIIMVLGLRYAILLTDTR